MTGFAAAAFEADLKAVVGARLEAPWPVVRVAGSLAVIAIMSRASEPQERYLARLHWQRYPDDPPSLKFIDAVTGRDDIASAWPNGSPFRPQTLDACTNYCAEGFTIHPEWKQDANLSWKSDGNVLLKVLRYLQDDLDIRATGRFAG